MTHDAHDHEHHHDHDHDHDHDHHHEHDDEPILTGKQRKEMAAYVDVADPSGMTDEELLSEAADRIGLEGELAVDPEGTLEFERGQLLVILESVAEEHTDEVDHPDHLHLAIYVRPETEQERAELEAADLIDEGSAETAEQEGWSYAWWGGMCTQLGREAPLPQQLEALHKVMTEAETVIQQRDLGDFFKRLKWLEKETEE